MATVAKYPTAAVTLANLGGEFPNFPEAVLSGAHTNAVTTITLTATVNAAWPTTGGWVTIDSEIIQFTGVSGATLTGCTRASQGTTAATHADQAKVGLYLTAATVNQIAAEVIAVEAYSLATDRWRWTYDGTYAPTETTVTGSGAVALVAAFAARQFATGATSGSKASSRNFFGYSSHFAVGAVRRWQLGAVFDNLDANTTFAVFVTTENITGGIPSLTANHIGIRHALGGTVVLFSTADGTTELTTDISAFVTAGKHHNYVVRNDGTTVKLYIDGSLRATHATNAPSSVLSSFLNFYCHIENNAAAAKTMEVMHVDVDTAS